MTSDSTGDDYKSGISVDGPRSSVESIGIGGDTKSQKICTNKSSSIGDNCMILSLVLVSVETTTNESDDSTNNDDFVVRGLLKEAAGEDQNDGTQVSAHNREHQFFDDCIKKTGSDHGNKDANTKHDEEGRHIKLIGGEQVVGNSEDGTPNEGADEDPP